MVTDKKVIQKEMEATRVFTLDMDGTICLGKSLFLYTHNFFDTVKATEREYYFFTSNSPRDLAVYIDKLHSMGIDIDKKQMMVPTHVIPRWLRKYRDDRRVYVAGTPTLRKEFEAYGWILDEERPDIVILGFGITLTYKKLFKVCTSIREGALYYGINPDLNCPTEHDTFIPDYGSVTKLIGASTGEYPELLGKSSGKTLDYIVEETGCPPDQIAIIGDRLCTDIKVADDSETASIFVLGGETKAEDIDISDAKPDVVIEHIGEPAKLLQEYLKK